MTYGCQNQAEELKKEIKFLKLTFLILIDTSFGFLIWCLGDGLIQIYNKFKSFILHQVYPLILISDLFEVGPIT